MQRLGKENGRGMDGQQRPENSVEKLLRIRRFHRASSAPKSKVEELLHNLVADYAAVCGQGFSDEFFCALCLGRVYSIEGIDQDVAVKEEPTVHSARLASNADQLLH